MAAAVLTPPDVISQLSFAIPMLLLYEASIFSVARVERRRAAQRNAEGLDPYKRRPYEASAVRAEATGTAGST